MPCGHINFGLEIVFQLFVFDIADNSNDFTRDRFTVKLGLPPHADRDAFAERVFIGPETPDGGFIDNRHARMFHVIGVRKIAPGEQRNAHRREIARRDLMSVGVRLVSLLSWATINDERTMAARAAEGQTGYESGGLDAGNGARLFESAAKEFGLPPVFGIFGARQV